MISYGKQSIDKSDINSVTNVIKRGTDWACGQEINQLENKLNQFEELYYKNKLIKFSSNKEQYLKLY